MTAELLRMALRNAFRYRRRTVLTCLAIAFGLGLTIVGMALFTGVEKTSLDHIKDSETAHFLIYPEKRSAGNLIVNPLALAARTYCFFNSSSMAGRVT